MTVGGTTAYSDRTDIPPLVVAAVELARQAGFDCSCRPEQGRLLQLLAAGRRGGRIGETGTGYGVGLAWLFTGAGSSTEIISVERDPERADAARGLFAELDNVTIIEGDWSQILVRGPFDLFVIDGGGSGKSPGDAAIEPREVLTPFGTVVIDDFTPLQRWPPMHLGRPDEARLHWLTHPDLLATELVVCDEMSTIVGSLKA
jgi:predicted O-methyltransferase YrrM